MISKIPGPVSAASGGYPRFYSTHDINNSINREDSHPGTSKKHKTIKTGTRLVSKNMKNSQFFMLGGNFESFKRGAKFKNVAFLVKLFRKHNFEIYTMKKFGTFLSQKLLQKSRKVYTSPPIPAPPIPPDKYLNVRNLLSPKHTSWKKWHSHSPIRLQFICAGIPPRKYSEKVFIAQQTQETHLNRRKIPENTANLGFTIFFLFFSVFRGPKKVLDSSFAK